MYLRYLWVQQYKNLVSQGFHFDPTLAVYYEASTGVLEIERVASQLPEHFFGPRITNVTGILGTNGSGKSTLLEFIQLLTGSFQDSDRLIFNAHNEAILILDDYVLYHESLRLDQRRSKIDGFTLLPYKGGISDNARRRASPDDQYRSFYEFALVAYSNNFETSVDNDNPNVIDVSTSHLINSSIWRQQAAGRASYVSFIEFESREFQAEIDLFQYLADNELEGSIPFAVPPYISLKSLDPSAVASLRELDEAFLEANQASQLSFWLNELKTAFFPNQEVEPFEEFLQRVISIHLLVLLQLYPQNLSTLTPTALTALRALEYDANDLPAEVIAGLDGLQVFVQFLRVLHGRELLRLPPRVSDYQETTHDTVHLQASSTAERALVRVFFDLNRLSALSNIKVTNLRWAGLSTGQAAYLRLFARFYSAFTQIKERNNEQFYQVKKLLILVDEGEANFHPQWQKQFLNVLLTILNTFFAEFADLL
jgi:energy-coupling factor transporter ATP-binding protein EcfA2